MTKFLHRLFKPHCEHCRDEVREAKVCPTCEVFASQLELANYQNKQLLSTIERMNNPTPLVVPETTAVEPIQPRTVPWSIRRNILEGEDRKKAELMRSAAKESTEQLEKELEVGQDGTRESAS